MKRFHLNLSLLLLAVVLTALGAAWWIGWITYFAPIWLLSLPAVPLVIWLSWRGLSGLPPRTAMLSLLVRLTVLLLLINSLADLRLVLRNNGLTVYFLLDHSASIPESIVEQQLLYAREASLGKDAEDRAGLLVFGADASVEGVAERELRVGTIHSTVNRDYTNIEQALRLAAAAFPDNTRRKIVLMTDGNENIGTLLGGVRHLVGNRIDLDILPVQYDYADEVLVEKVHLPEKVKRDETFDLKVHIRSLHTNGGVLTIYRNGQPIAEQQVELEAGTNTFTITQKLTEPNFYSYSARIAPRRDAIAQNNIGRSAVYIQGESRVLLVAPTYLEAEFLAAACRTENLESSIIQPAQLPQSIGQMQNYDCIVLCNVGADDLPGGIEQMRMLRSAVRDSGIGLVMVGGMNSFGMGNYRKTPIEDALPVEMDLTNRKVMPNGALIVVIDRSGSMVGDKLELAKPAAWAAIEVLSPGDYAGVIAFDGSPYWQLKPTIVGEERGAIRNQIFSLQPGGGTDIMSALREAHAVLRGIDASVRHIIILSDGQSDHAGFDALMEAIKKDSITVSSVGISEPGGQPLMEAIAHRGGGRFYFVNDPHTLPRIFIKEAMVVRRGLVFNEPFQPMLVVNSELTKGMRPEELPPLKAYVATTPKPRAMVPIVSDNENHDPIFAYWNFGLGKSVAFTSDATSNWGEYWVGWDQFNKFWGQVIRWSSRKREVSDLEVSTTVQGSEGRLVIDAVNLQGEFINFLDLQARLIDPEYEGHQLEIRQTAPGRYEASFPAEKVGSNLLNITYQNPATGDRGFVSSGVAVPYPPEYRQLRTNSGLLQRAASLAEGRLLMGDPQLDAVYESELPPVRAFQSIWGWLIITAVLLFFFDVFLRRVIINREDVVYAVDRVRGWIPMVRPRKAARDATIGTLLQRKKEVAEAHKGRDEAIQSIFKQQLEADAEAAEVEALPVNRPDAATPAASADSRPRGTAKASSDKAPMDAPKQADEGGGYTGRLLAAKRRARKRDQESEDNDT